MGVANTLMIPQILHVLPLDLRVILARADIATQYFSRDRNLPEWHLVT
jgi:hypothetical protein